MGTSGGDARASARAVPVIRPRPPSPGNRFVVRDRLVQQLVAPRYETTILISGAGGAGKSTLGRQWLERDDRVRAEIRVSPALQSPARLAQALVTALESLDPSLVEAHAVPTAAEPFFSAVLLPSLTDLAATRPNAYVLLVDDVHLLTDPACHLLLQAVSDGVPEGSALALLSRERSPAWLTRTLAEGRLFGLGAESLAFDVQEASALFRGMECAVPEPEVARAVEHSGGWAVALYLGALGLRGRPERLREEMLSLPRGPDHNTGSYVRSQILDHLDEDTREFLVRTSILDELEPGLCDAVLGRSDSAKVLAWLHQRLQLDQEVDPVRHRLRLHQLVTEALKEELDRHEHFVVSTLHRRASDWYARHGDLDSAIRHAQASGYLPSVGALVWPEVPVCVGSGRPDRLQGWLAAMSDDDIARERWLSLAAAWSCLQSGEDARMERWIRVAADHAGRDWRTTSPPDEYAGSLAAIEAVVGRHGLDDVLSLCSIAAEGMPAASPFQAPVSFLRGVALTLRGDTQSGVASLEEAVRLSRALGVPLLAADGSAWLGVVSLLRGDTNQGLALIDEAAAVIAEHDLELLATSAHSLTALALAQAIRHDTAHASKTLAKARMMTPMIAGIAPWFAVSGRLVQARAAVMLGQGSVARTLIAEARSLMTPDLEGPLITDLLSQTEAQLRMLSVEGVSAATLTAAELRVLQFLPSHLSFPQISERMFLSSNTVKTHALAIYRKLGVSTRGDAVARARSLGLLDQ
jgi:LuxR family transcriptional regulator, maltose regulon positive regulatory protein